METILEVAKYLFENGPAIVTAVVGVLSALMILFMLIPGEQPEKFMKMVVDFLAKFSAKPPAK